MRAAGTNIAISAAAAASGSVRHVREGRVDWRIVAWMAPPSVVGAVAGALFAEDVPRSALYAIISLVLLWSGVDLALRPIRPVERARPRVAPAALFGGAIGAIGGAVGVILGTLRMPALVRSVGLDVRRAAGTNLVVGAMLGAAAFGTHAAALDIDWPILAAGLVGAIPGGWLGARWTGVVSETTLRLALGAALVAVGLAFAVEAVLA